MAWVIAGTFKNGKVGDEFISVFPGPGIKIGKQNLMNAKDGIVAEDSLTGQKAEGIGKTQFKRKMLRSLNFFMIF